MATIKVTANELVTLINSQRPLSINLFEDSSIGAIISEGITLNVSEMEVKGAFEHGELAVNYTLSKSSDDIICEIELCK